MRVKHVLLVGALGLILCALAVWGAILFQEDAAPPGPVFPMRKVSVFDKIDIPDSESLARGQIVNCTTQPDAGVTAYPKLKSIRPLYGKAIFDRSPYNPSAATPMEFNFALDASGETPPGHLENAKAYDRLYFDLNRDLDLTNDPVLKPMKNPPPQSIRFGDRMTQAATFEYLNLVLDYGPGVGMRPFRVLPHFIALADDHENYYRMVFVAAWARQGRIRIGTHEYEALIGQPYFVTGRFDRPFNSLLLKPVDPDDKLPYWGWSDDRLGFMRWVDGELYATVASPLGDTLTIEPYRGDYGVFEVGPGGRDVNDISMRGDLDSQSSIVGVGAPRLSDDRQEKLRRSRVPVGDYLTDSLSIEFGRLHIFISNNYHSEGKRQDQDRPRIYGIHIRKDRPFVLDFSNKPAVLFTSPTKDQVVKLGEEIKVAGVLIDPKLDFMIRELFDTTRKVKKIDDLGGGKTRTHERDLSLAPIVKITNAAGQLVAEGKMPFG